MSRFELSLENAAKTLASGGLAAYPTETFYALGCRIDSLAALRKLPGIKRRSLSKPLSALAASEEQAALIADLSEAPRELLNFWPGPLTIVARAREHLANLLINPQLKTAVRVSSSHTARALARAAGAPLVATSANFSGCPPAQTWGELDPEFLLACETSGLPFCLVTVEDASVREKAKILPSTIVEPIRESGRTLLRVLREGQIGVGTLREAGFRVEITGNNRR